MIRITNNRDTVYLFTPHQDHVIIQKYTTGHAGRAFTRSIMTLEDGREFYSKCIKTQGYQKCQDSQY